jgi:pimeloyl-ACP methyl ester carboxylesterase
MLVGPDWRTGVERDLPGSVAQMERDARTFFETDLPAILGWRFPTADARHVTCPVLHVGGTASGPWFGQVRRWVRELFPDAADVVVEGADHSLAITHADQVAAAVLPFLRRHPY